MGNEPSRPDSRTQSHISNSRAQLAGLLCGDVAAHALPSVGSQRSTTSKTESTTKYAGQSIHPRTKEREFESREGRSGKQAKRGAQHVEIIACLALQSSVCSWSQDVCLLAYKSIHRAQPRSPNAGIPAEQERNGTSAPCVPRWTTGGCGDKNQAWRQTQSR